MGKGNKKIIEQFRSMKEIIALALWILAGTAFGQKSFDWEFNIAPTELSLVGEDVISTFINERDFAMSPDGKEVYFTISTPKSSVQTIVFCQQVRKGVWTLPEVVSFAGEFSDLEPAFSADGQTLFFASNRPLSGSNPKDFDIWKVSRVGKDWGKPENLGLPINTESDEFYPSVAKNGNLYFTATYKNGIGREDIFISRFNNNRYQIPEVLDTAINSKFYEFNAFISPEEDYIIFTTYGRQGDLGGGDLYISKKNPNGQWMPSENLRMLNSKQLDYCPSVSPDGKVLFFTSDRHQLPQSFSNPKANYQSIKETTTQVLNGVGNIYWVSFDSVLDSLYLK